MPRHTGTRGRARTQTAVHTQRDMHTPTASLLAELKVLLREHLRGALLLKRNLGLLDQVRTMMQLFLVTETVTLGGAHGLRRRPTNLALAALCGELLHARVVGDAAVAV